MGIFKTKEFKNFCWVTLYGFIGIVITYLAKVDWAFAPIITAFLNMASKSLYTYLKANNIQ